MSPLADIGNVTMASISPATLRRRALLVAGGLALVGAGPARTQPGASVPRFMVALDGHDALRGWGDATFRPPAVVVLTVGRLGAPGAVASTQGDAVTVDVDFLLAHPGAANDVQLLAHELVHVVQKYPEPRTVWLTEGIADWIRYYVILPDDPRRAFPAGVSFTRGYQPAAALLDWCERRTPGVVAAVHRAMRRGEDGPGTLQKLAGASPEDLWRTCPASRLGVLAAS